MKIDLGKNLNVRVNEIILGDNIDFVVAQNPQYVKA